MTSVTKPCQHVDFTEATDDSRKCLACELETPSCGIDDLRAHAIIMVAIDDDGSPIHYEPREPPSEDGEYWRVGCDHSFSSWDEAGAHLATQVPEAA